MDTGLDPYGLVMLLIAACLVVVVLAMSSGGVHMYKTAGDDPTWCYIHDVRDGKPSLAEGQ